jgi:hypothetical protein
MTFKWAILAFPIFTFACKNNPETVVQPPVMPIMTAGFFQLNEGDCEKKCVEFTLKYPKVAKGSPALRDSLQQWVENKVRDNSNSSEEPRTQRISMDQAGKEFVDMWKVDESALSYSFEMRDTLLAVTPKFITLRLDFYTYTGGAHPNYTAELVVFNAETGQIVSPISYIKNESAILPMLDTAYRAEKAEAFAEGNEVYEGGKIPFPTQYAITENGILFHYNTYEIGPYVLGDADIFLTWTDLGTAAINPFQ